MKILNTQERYDFVSNVVNACIIDNMYVPAVFDIVFCIELARTVLEMEIPDDEAEYSKFVFDNKLLSSDIAMDSQVSSLRDACLITIKMRHDEFTSYAIIGTIQSIAAPFVNAVKSFNKYLTAAKKDMKDTDMDKLLDVVSKLSDMDTSNVASNIVKVKFDKDKVNRSGRKKPSDSSV